MSLYKCYKVIELCYHRQDIWCFYHSPKFPHVPSQSPPPPPGPGSHPLLSIITVSPFLECHMESYGTWSFESRLLSLTIMFLRLTHIVACIHSFLLITDWCCIAWVPKTVYPGTHEWVVCLQFRQLWINRYNHSHSDLTLDINLFSWLSMSGIP